MMKDDYTLEMWRGLIFMAVSKANGKLFTKEGNLLPELNSVFARMARDGFHPFTMSKELYHQYRRFMLVDIAKKKLRGQDG